MVEYGTDIGPVADSLEDVLGVVLGKPPQELEDFNIRCGLILEIMIVPLEGLRGCLSRLRRIATLEAALEAPPAGRPVAGALTTRSAFWAPRSLVEY